MIDGSTVQGTRTVGHESKDTLGETFGEIAIRVDAAISQERPVRTAEFYPCQIAIREHNFFACQPRRASHCAVG